MREPAVSKSETQFILAMSEGNADIKNSTLALRSAYLAGRHWLHKVCTASVGFVEEFLIIVIIEHLVPDRPFVNALICFMSCCKLS